MSSQLPIVAEAGLLMNTHLISRTTLGLALGLAITTQASAFVPDVIHRQAEVEGARLEVTLRRDRESFPVAVSLEVALTNTADRQVLLPGGAERYGLELVLRTEDGRILRDHSAQPEEAPLVEERTIRNPGDGGREEERYVIESRVKLGKKTWDAEFTLADRTNMQYQVLIGREAIRERFVVNVAESFLRSDKPSAVSEEDSD